MTLEVSGVGSVTSADGSVTSADGSRAGCICNNKICIIGIIKTPFRKLDTMILGKYMVVSLIHYYGYTYFLIFQMPSSEQEWKDIAQEFGERYQFWNCLGALDGKHVAIQKPPHTGSLYFNYKGYFSIVLMALANARKEFIMIDVGANGRVSDGGVLFYTKFWELYQQGSLFLPEPTTLPNTQDNFPYVFIGDEAFALGENLMKPYPQSACNHDRKTFNYRLSRARSNIECAFGILRSKFGVF